MVPVVVAQATEQDVPIDIDAIGNVEAFSTISVRSQVTGVLTAVLFNEGDFVNAGDHLFTIDPRPYEAQLQQARANLARDQALLSQAEAQLARDIANADYARKQSDRQNQLATLGIISRDQADQMSAGAEATAAAVNADRAAVESARAQLAAQQATVDNSAVQLGYTAIRSPITGRTGNLIVKMGNLVTANSTELMTIAEVKPAYVTFAVPAEHLPEIKRHLTENRLEVMATPQDTDTPLPTSGKLTFVDNAVDTATDTIKLKATFENIDRRLWPGEFARVSLHLSTLSGATVVPSEAVQTGQDGQFVFVVGPNATVEQRPVTTGPRFKEATVVTKGLEPGETVVTEGQLRLEPGTRVQFDGEGSELGQAAAAPARGRGRRGGQPRGN